MPVFEIEKDGKTFEVEAPDMQAAAGALQRMPSAAPSSFGPQASGYQAQPGFHVAGSSGGVTIELPGQMSPGAPQHTPGYDKALSQMVVREARINKDLGGAKGPLDALNSGTALSFADELAGGIEAARVLGKRVLGNDPGYSAREAYDAGRDAYNMDRKRFSQAHPVADVALQVAGGLATPGAGAAGEFVGAAPSLTGAALRSGAVGGVYGALAGAGSSDGGVKERLTGAAKGAAGGAVVGGLVPPVARAVGAGVNAVGRAMAPAPVQGVSRRAGQVLADVIDPASAQQLQQLGPEAMLVDASPSAVGLAQGVATRPGAGRDALVAALTQRNQGANARLATDVNAALGPNVVPSQVESGLQAARRALSPQYRQALAGAGDVDLTGAISVLNDEASIAKGPIARSLQTVRNMLETPVSGTQMSQLESRPEGVLAARQALDDMIETAQGNERRILTAVRNEVADALRTAAPAIGQLDDQFAGLMRQSDALQTGQQLLDSGRTAIRPQELADMMATNAPEANDALRMGLRGDIDRQIGTKANDLVALRNVVKGEGDWNRARLSEVFGPAEANRVLNAVDREAAFADAYRRLVQNSETASRQGGAKFLEQQALTIPRETPQTIMGAGLEMGRRMAQAVLGNRMTARTDALANELGPILTARGAEREALVRQLLAGNARTAAAQLSAEESRRLSEYLLQTAPKAVGAGLGDRPKDTAAGRRP